MSETLKISKLSDAILLQSLLNRGWVTQFKELIWPSEEPVDHHHEARTHPRNASLSPSVSFSCSVIFLTRLLNSLSPPECLVIGPSGPLLHH